MGIVFALSFFLAFSYGSTPHAHTSCQVRDSLPDPACTPGGIFPNATKEQICVPGYARSVRNVSSSTKEKVYVAYGVLSRKNGEHAIDHLISLQIGGSNEVKNLWPLAVEPKSKKDKIENDLHDQVCDGKMSLKDAQIAIAKNWKTSLSLSEGETKGAIIVTPQITELIVGIVGIAFPFLWHWAGTQKQKSVQKFEQSLPEKQRSILEKIIRDGVQMVEQRYANYSPEDKRKEAENAIYTAANYFGLPAPDPVVVRTILESTVFSVKQSPTPPASPGTSMQFR